MPLLRLFGRKRLERAGFALYTEAVRSARDPYFYAELEVPDTLDGRFDMIGLFVFLLIDRLHTVSESGAALAQAVFDAMFLDMDFALREMGVSDMTVGRRVKAMWEALNGRSQAYAAPLAAGDRAGLAAALSRNVWRGAEPGPHALALADVAIRQRAHLAGQSLDALLQGRVAFLPAPAVA
ncbi:MAG TPA: ubiquinol-cytochrome C chaperone family protein [Acetobacteraceae bacterium]|nr:ubiquinol-cytochrome C chaperone family protein [Acetobacteraceae bacterium]